MIEALFSQLRLCVVGLVVILCVWVLGTRLHEVQMTKQDDYLKEIQFDSRNQILVRKPGIRGEILDRNGVVLATNASRYQVALNLQQVYNHWADLDVESQKLLGDNPSIDELAEVYSLAPLRARFGYEFEFSKRSLQSHFLTHGGVLPFVVLDEVSFDEVSKLSEASHEIPGLLVQMGIQREYPYDALGSHLLGYTKQWAKGGVSDEDKYKYDHFIGDEVGVAGIESAMNSQLQGAPSEEVYVKVKNREIKKIKASGLKSGSDVHLTIDANLQYHAESILRYVGRGALVVMDVKTGEVLALASVPSFDPNDFIGGITSDKQRYYTKNLASPFTNLTLEGMAPGSTFKVATAVAGARAGLGNRDFRCNGFVTYNRIKIGCWLYNKSRGSHGRLNLSEALKRSCNPFFNEMASGINEESLVNSFEMLGFGRSTSVGLPGEKSGILIGSLGWKRLNLFQSNLTKVDKAMLSFGQGVSLATPLQLVKMTTAIANGGKVFRPSIYRDSKAEIGTPSKPLVDLVEQGVSPGVIKKIQQGMWKAANELGGTARRALQAEEGEFVIAAKTGTAQTSDFGKKSHNALVISFAPYESPRYAVVAVVKGGASGGKVAGPLVKRMYACLQAWENNTLPPAKPMQDYPGHISYVKGVQIPIKGTPQESFLIKTPEDNEKEPLSNTN